MPYPHAHLHLRFSGTFGSVPSTPNDLWSTGLRLGIIGADVPHDPGNLQTFVDSAWTAAATFHGTTATGTGNMAYLTSAQVGRVGLDGKYLPQAQVTKRKDVAGGVQGAGTANMPFNTALVISLRTDLPRGYASNGRVYWPCLAPTMVNTTGLVNSSTVSARLNAFKTFIESLNTAAAAYQTNMRVCVMSKVGEGLAAKVTAIRSDSRLDSIERRENDTPPVYTVATITQV